MNTTRMFRALALFPEARPPCGPPAPVPLHLHGWRGATPGERAELARARSASELCWTEDGCPRATRKASLRRAEETLGATGLAILDLGARRIWSREALALEGEHDAELDVLQLFHGHVVVSGRRRWLHTHGLAELGGIDFEVLDAGAGLLEGGDEFLRRMGEASLHGEIDDQTRNFWLGRDAGWVQLVPVAEFMAAAPRALRRLRTPELPGHGGPRRRVLCDSDSFRLRPPPALKREAALVFEVPSACQLRRDSRGRATARQGRRFLEELGGMVRTAYVEVDRCSEVDWMELEGWDELVVTGRGICEGERVVGRWEDVIDWVLVTDLGDVTPVDTAPVRQLRETLEELEAGPPLH